MKKTLFIAAAFLALAACNKPEPENPGNEDNGTTELSAPVLTAGSESVTVSPDNLDGDVLTLAWTSAAPDGSDVDISYSVYANDASKDMYSSPVIYRAAGLSYSFTGNALNELVRNVAGDDAAEAELQFSVYAVSDDDDVESVVSNVVKVKVTAYEEVVEIPSVLWIAGSATDAGWDVSNGIACPGNGNVYRAENVNLNVTITDTGFKFYFSNDGSSEYFIGPDRSSETFGAAMIYKKDDGTANLFQPAMNGYSSGKYTITLDTDKMMMTLERTGDSDASVELGEEVYFCGGCFDWGWDFTTPVPRINDGIYEIENVRCRWGDNKDSGFKIFAGYQKWSPYFAQGGDASHDNITITLVSDSEVPQFYPGQLGYDDGWYTLRADFNAMTLTLTPGENPNPGDGFDENSAMYVLGGGFEKYGDVWTPARERALIPLGDGTYESENPIWLNKWAYFQFATGDWSKQYSRDDSASSYWTACVKGENEKNFIPGDYDPDWKDGWYDIKFDENNLTVTCTPVKSDVDPSVAFYLYGGGFGDAYSDWTFHEDLALMPVEDNVYQTLKPVHFLSSTYFKFEKQDWTEYVRDNGASDYWTVVKRSHDPDNDSSFSPSGAGLSEGDYHVKLDLNTMKVTITR